MHRVPLAALTGCAAAIALLAACTSSSSKNAGHTPASGSSSSSASPSASAPISAAGLADKMRSAATSLTSAHVALAISTAGQNVTAQGNEKLSGGKLTALDMSEQIGTLTIGIRILGSTIYAKLPPSSGVPAGKPWIKASTTSTDPSLRQIATSITSAEQSASLDGYRSFAQAATSVKDLGSSQINGTSATKYSLVVDVSKLPASAATQALKTAGLTTLPVDLWLDDQGRPVQFVENLTVQGKPVATKVTITNFNAPVTITAPPANQITTG
jgi:hypothetical protein